VAAYLGDELDPHDAADASTAATEASRG